MREGDFVDRLFSVMDAAQGFPPVSDGEVKQRIELLRASRGSVPPRDPTLLEEDRRALEEAIRDELER